MKVAIFGSYNGGSIGDTAILLGLISSIFRVLGDDVEVTVLALGNLGVNEELEELGHEQRIKEIAVDRKLDNSLYGVGGYVNKSWRLWKRIGGRPPVNQSRIRRILRSSDVLLVGGGNLVMDIYKRWPKILSNVCGLAIEEKLPYYFIGVGAAPINTLEGKKDLLYSLRSAVDVYFRDSESKKYCYESLGFAKSSVGPDLAFGINWGRPEKTNKENALMLNLASVYGERWPTKDPDKYNSYLSNMVGIVDRLVEMLNIKEVIVFNTNYPLDEFAAEDFIKEYEGASRFRVSMSLLKGKNTVSRLLKVCSKANFSLVTRLHAGIISRISGARVFAIEYHPKVRDVLENQASDTIVESFDAVLSGAAFESIDKIFDQKTPDRNCVDCNEVDKLLSLVLKSALPE